MSFAIAKLPREIGAGCGLGGFQGGDAFAIKHDFHCAIAGGEQHGLEQLALMFH